MNRSTLVFAIALVGLLVPATGTAFAQDAGGTASSDSGSLSGDAAADDDEPADTAQERVAKGRMKVGRVHLEADPAGGSAGDPIPDIDITVGVDAQDGADGNEASADGTEAPPDEASVPALDANPVP